MKKFVRIGILGGLLAAVVLVGGIEVRQLSRGRQARAEQAAASCEAQEAYEEQMRRWSEDEVLLESCQEANEQQEQALQAQQETLDELDDKCQEQEEVRASLQEQVERESEALADASRRQEELRQQISALK